MSNLQVAVPAATHPWRTVFDLAMTTGDPTSWRLTGGLMVQLHAMAHGRTARYTEDADFLVDVLTHRNAVRKVRDALQQLGFVIHEGTMSGYTTRMYKGDAEVDLLVDNHLSPFLRPRAILGRQPMLGMPGSRRAVLRSELVDLEYQGRVATVCVPDLLGALLMKAASWNETSGIGRERHLEDAALLLSLMDGDGCEELKRLDNRSRSDRKNIRVLERMLLGPDGEEYMSNLDRSQRAHARMVLTTLTRLLSMPRRHGETADFLGK